MSRPLSFRIPVVELTLTSGRRVRQALGFDWFSTEVSGDQLVDRGLTKLDDESLRYGDYLPLLHGRPPEDVMSERVEVSFHPTTFAGVPQELVVEFDVLIATYAHGPLRGFVPAIGTVASGTTVDELRRALADMIRLDFDKHERFEDVRHVLATQWYTGLEVTYFERQVNLYSPGELAEFERERDKPDSVLESVATRMSDDGFKAFGMQEVLARIEDATSGAIRGSVLIVGSPGSGKTACVRDWSSRTSETVWRTSAAQLVTELTREMGWQGAFADLCTELTERKDYLYVGNLTELMEVGRYIGNPVSIGEALRPWIERGTLRVVAEVTEEGAAALDATIPGYRQLFVEIRMPTPDPEDMRDLTRSAVSARAAQGGVKVSERGFDEGFSLFARFAPYSGFPGRPIRFFDSLVRSVPIGTELDRDDVLLAFSEESGLPLDLVDSEAKLDIDGTREWFGARLFGQDAAIDGVVDVIAMMKSRLNRPGRPAANMLFAGPTGVGKTQLTRLVAEHLFGDSERMVRLDMSEYSHPAAAMRLISGPNGEGLLTGAVRREPFSVLLFDEIEKAHPLVFDMLLQILGEGRLTGDDGRVTDFCSTIIILTSNLGVSEERSMIRGFGHEDVEAERRRRIAAYRRAVREFFRPEFVGRLDRLVVFSPLVDDVLSRVSRAALRSLAQRPGLAHRGIEFEISEAAVQELVRVGADPRYGARPLERAADRYVAIPLARSLAAAEGRVGEVMVDAGEGGISVETAAFDAERASDSELLFALCDRVSQLRQSLASVRKGKACAVLQESVDVWRRRLLSPLPADDRAFGGVEGRARVAEGVLRAFDDLMGELRLLETNALESVRSGSFEDHEIHQLEYDELDEKTRARYHDLLGRFIPDDKAILIAISSEEQRATRFGVDHFMRVCEAFDWKVSWTPLDIDFRGGAFKEVSRDELDDLFKVQSGRMWSVLACIEGPAIRQLLSFEEGIIDSRRSDERWTYSATFYARNDRRNYDGYVPSENQTIIRTLGDEHIKYANGGKVNRPGDMTVAEHFASLSTNAIRHRIVGTLVKGKP